MLDILKYGESCIFQNQGQNKCVYKIKGDNSIAIVIDRLIIISPVREYRYSECFKVSLP